MTTREEIISKVAGDKKLKDYCSMLCRGRDIKEDMWQELLLLICETAEEALFQIYSEGYLFKWCGAVLKNLNRKRLDVNNSKNTRHQSLREISYSHVELSGYEAQDSTYDHSKDERINDVLKHMKHIRANPVLVIMPIKEICETTGRTEGSIKWERSNIIKSVRENIKREYIPAK